MNHSPYEILLNQMMNDPEGERFYFKGRLGPNEEENLRDRMDIIHSIDYNPNNDTTTITTTTGRLDDFMRNGE